MAKGDKKGKSGSKRTKSENPHFDSLMKNQSIFSKEQISEEDDTVVIKADLNSPV